MSYILPANLAHAEESAPLAVKLAAVVGAVREVLALHDAAFLRAGGVVDFATDDTLLMGARERQVRLAVMGEPARFAEVLWDGDQGAGYDGGEGLATVAHRFRIYVYWGAAALPDVPPSDAQRAAAADAFRAACEGTDPDAPGLLWALRQQRAIVHPESAAPGAREWVLDLSAPADVAAAYVVPDPRNRADDRHELAFTLLVS